MVSYDTWLMYKTYSYILHDVEKKGKESLCHIYL